MTDAGYDPADVYQVGGSFCNPIPFPGEDGGRDLLGTSRELIHRAHRGPATEYEYNQKSHRSAGHQIRNGLPWRPYRHRAGDQERDAWVAAQVAEARKIAARRIALIEGDQ